MATARPFPMDDPAADPPATRAALRPDSTSSSESRSRWPVLAQITKVGQTEASQARQTAQPAAPSFRIDPPHNYAGSPSPTIPATTAKPTTGPGARPLPLPKPLAPRPLPRAATGPAEIANDERDERVLKSTPLPIRLTVQALRWSEPYQPVIRFAAMLALMVVGGMSLTLMLNSKVEPSGAPSDNTAAVAEPTATLEIDTQQVDTDHIIAPALTPQTDTTSTEPTAIGPLSPQPAPLMAVESDTTPAKPIYPTTAFAEPELSKVVDSLPPRVQTTEPAVARLRGIVEETKSR